MGSFPSDVQIKVNIDPASAIANFKKIEEHIQKGAQGMAGEYEKAAKVGMSMVKQMLDSSSRAGKQLENQLRSVERQTQQLGKTAVERNETERKWMLDRAKGLKNQEEQEKRINALYEQRRKYFQEEERRQNAGPSSMNLLLRGARDIFEGRMSYGTMDIGRALFNMGGGAAGGAVGNAAGGAAAAGLSTTAIAVGGIAAALIGVATAGYKAAESIGALGARIHEVQLVTGMSAREVQTYELAAKMAGKSSEDASQLMRYITVAATEQTAAAEKARKGLRELGVDYVGMEMGVVGVSTAIQQMSEGLKKNPELLQRNAALMDVFKRSAFQSAGSIIEYADAVAKAQSIPFLNDKQIDEAKKMNDQLIVMATQLGVIVEHLAFFAGKAFMGVLHSGAMQSPLVIAAEAAIAWMSPPPPPVLPSAQGAAGSIKEHRAQRMEQFQTMLSNLPGDEAQDQELKRRKEEYDAAQKNSQLWLQHPGQYQTEVARTRTRYESQQKIVEDRRKAKSAAETVAGEVARVQEQLADIQASPYRLPAQVELDKYREARAKEAAGFLPEGQRAAYVEAQVAKVQPYYQKLTGIQAEQQKQKFATQMLEVQETTQRELGRVRLGGVTPVDVRQLGVEGVTRGDVEKDIVERYQRRVEIAKETRQIEEDLINKRVIKETDLVGLAQKQRDLEAAAGKEQVANAEATLGIKKDAHALAIQEQAEERKHTETMSKIQLADQEDTIKHNADLARRRAELRFKGESPAESIAEEYRIAVTEANDLYDAEMRRIELHETGNKKEEAATQALIKLHREDEKASEDAQFRMAKMQQDQLDKIAKTVEPLYHTLFTNPKQFGTQLRQTVQEAALHPLVTGLSELTATALHPFIYGASGTGGIAGAFSHMFGGGGGKLDSLKLTSSGNVPVEIKNGHELFGSPGTGIFGGYRTGGGTGGSPWSGWFGGFGGGGGTVDQFPSFGGFGTPPFVSGGDTFGGGMGQVSRGTSFGMGLAQAAMKSVLGGGQSSARGTAGYAQKLAGLFGAFGGSYAGSGGLGRVGTNIGQYGGAVTSTTATDSARFQALSTGPFAGTPGGPAAGALGMMLAQSGAFGNLRGTAGGTAMLAGGGFLVAGPVGAAIGFGIGMGEYAAGVESPRNEAKRLARQYYHIDVNNSAADQIVSIANQSYGGRVSVAIRSPEVRHMMGLYAAGTGQQSLFQQSSNDPHGASLVESGGGLYQQATYQYGQAYTQSSNLPVFGGVQSTQLGAPGGGMSISLNVGGTDAAKFMTGQVVTPEVIQGQYASAMYGSTGRVSQSLMMQEPGGYRKLMPYNMTPAAITNVMPQSLSLSFTEHYIYPLLAVMYNDGTFERSLITDGGVNPPRYLRTFNLTKRLTTPQLTTLLNFWEDTVQGGLVPFYFYNPFAVCPVGSNYDPTGTVTDGRVPVFFRGNWSQQTGMGRHLGPNIVLVETADLVAVPKR